MIKEITPRGFDKLQEFKLLLEVSEKVDNMLTPNDYMAGREQPRAEFWKNLSAELHLQIDVRSVEIASEVFELNSRGLPQKDRSL